MATTALSTCTTAAGIIADLTKNDRVGIGFRTFFSETLRAGGWATSHGRHLSTHTGAVAGNAGSTPSSEGPALCTHTPAGGIALFSFIKIFASQFRAPRDLDAPQDVAVVVDIGEEFDPLQTFGVFPDFVYDVV